MGPIRKHYIIFSCLLGGAVVAIAFLLSQLHDTSAEINSHWMPGAIHVSQVNMLTSDFRINELQHVLSTQEAEMAVYEERMGRLLEQINRELAQYETLIRTDAQRELYEEFRTKWQEYLSINSSMIELSRKNHNVEATAMLRARSETLFNDYSAALSHLVTDNRNAVEQKAETGSMIFVLSLINLAFIAGLAGYFLYRTTRHMRSLFDKVVSTCVNIMAQNPV